MECVLYDACDRSGALHSPLRTHNTVKGSFPLLSVQEKAVFADPHIFSIIIFYGAQLIYGVETLIMRIRLSRQITNQISRRTDKISTSNPIRQYFVAGSVSGTACRPKWGYCNTLAITWRPRYLNSKAEATRLFVGRYTSSTAFPFTTTVCSSYLHIPAFHYAFRNNESSLVSCCTYNLNASDFA